MRPARVQPFLACLPGIASLLLVAGGSRAADWEVRGDASAEIRFFPWNAEYEDQANSTASPSVALQPEIRIDWSDGADSITFRPFARWDYYDSERTHFDVREANYVHLSGTWDLLVGVTRVFWGVAESVHLVDILNQTDRVEDIDLEDKLGQPMLNLNWLHDSGSYGFYALFGFRERNFPKERYRGPFPIEDDDSPFTKGAGNGYVDFAFRWSHVVGEWDLGASYFFGTGREPRLVGRSDANGEVRVRPRYDLIHQIGIDVQWTHNSWLWKLEAIHRWGNGDPFFAVVGGFEYTFFGLFGTNADLGMLAEYQYDGRQANPDAPPTLFDNDVFLGTRLALNDEATTSLLAGVFVDVKNESSATILEAERRLTDHLKLELEARLSFKVDDDEDPLFLIRRDDSITLRLVYSF